MTDDLREQKKRLRREYRKRGAELSPAYRERADRAIREAITGSSFWQRARSAFLYVSMWAEPDTRELIDAALREGKRVYVPLCMPDRTMLAVRIRSMDELRPGMRDIPEPPQDAPRAAPGELDLVLAPCVTATAAGARLGHGAGFYDRFLRARTCPVLCLCYGNMLADTIPMEENDVQMDGVVTEAGITEAPRPPL